MHCSGAEAQDLLGPKTARLKPCPDTRLCISAAYGHFCGEFLRRVRKAGRPNNIACRWTPRHGVGSHGTLYFGDRLTVVQDLKRELPKGTLHAMLRQLGLSLNDIE